MLNLSIHINWWWAPKGGLNLVGNLIRYGVVIGLFIGFLYFSYRVFKFIVKESKGRNEMIGFILMGFLTWLWFLASLRLFGFISPNFGFANGEYGAPDKKGLMLDLFPIIVAVLFCIVYHYVIKPVFKKLLTHRTWGRSRGS